MNGTNNTSTDTVSLSAKTFSNNQKLKDSSFVKSTSILIGTKIGVGITYRLKYPKLFSKPSKKVCARS
jgi:hypothetical protein